MCANRRNTIKHNEHESSMKKNSTTSESFSELYISIIRFLTSSSEIWDDWRCPIYRLCVSVCARGRTSRGEFYTPLWALFNWQIIILFLNWDCGFALVAEEHFRWFVLLHTAATPCTRTHRPLHHLFFVICLQFKDCLITTTFCVRVLNATLDFFFRFFLSLRHARTRLFTNIIVRCLYAWIVFAFPNATQSLTATARTAWH